MDARPRTRRESESGLPGCFVSFCGYYSDPLCPVGPSPEVRVSFLPWPLAENTSTDPPVQTITASADMTLMLLIPYIYSSGTENRQADAPVHASVGCSRAKELFSTITGRRLSTSHALSTTRKIRLPNSRTDLFDDSRGRKGPHNRGYGYVNVCSSDWSNLLYFKGRSGRASTSMTSGERHLAFKYAASPLFRLSNFMVHKGSTASRYVGKQRHGVAVSETPTGIRARN